MEAANLGAAGAAAAQQANGQDMEKQLEEEFFKFFMESEMMDEILQDDE